MSLAIHNHKINSKVFSAFQDGVISTAPQKGTYNSIMYKRNHRTEKNKTKTKLITATASFVSTLLPMIYFAKKQNGLKKLIDLFKIDYGIKEVIALSSTSIISGVTAGILTDKKTDKKRKFKEGVFQFMNATIPTLFVGGVMKLLEDNVKYNHSRPVKTAAILTSMFAGMPFAAFLSNIINDPKDKEPDRKLTLKDSIANMDDALGALVVAKFPLIKQLHLDKVMPVIFAWCGYRAGQSN